MEYHCKNALCNATDPSQFTKSNKRMCRNCLTQKRHLAKRTQDLIETVEAAPPPEPVRRGRKPKAVAGAGVVKVGAGASSAETASLQHLISVQQKMLETQQRQTEALFHLTEKLISNAVGAVGAKVVSASSHSVASDASVINTHGVNENPHSYRSASKATAVAISHTPRRRQNLVHYKDRLNNDIF